MSQEPPGVGPVERVGGSGLRDDQAWGFVVCATWGCGLLILGGPSSPSLPGCRRPQQAWLRRDVSGQGAWPGGVLLGGWTGGGLGRVLRWATVSGRILWPFSLLGVPRRVHGQFQGSEMEQRTSSQLHMKL